MTGRGSKDERAIDATAPTLHGELADNGAESSPAAVATGPRSDERYEIVQTLGVGGMGEVLLVHDARIGRDVALKQLRDDARRRHAMEARFEQEVRLQGQLEHPSIVPVYDAGTRSDGTPFFTMRRAQGETLTQVLSRLAERDREARQKYTRRRLLSAFAQVCLAAHYAHEQGIVHRDIKPDNIVLGSYGEVWLLDWGVAKVIRGPRVSSLSDAPPRPVDPVETSVGSIVGSLQTMAPEQIEGRDLDARADVYALGAVLFEMLTLLPLHGRVDAPDLLTRVLTGIEARPSVRAPNVEVPPELEVICVKATARRREDRFATARALHDAVEAYLDGDRDLALRREHAARHAEEARIAANASLEKDLEWSEEEKARKRALGEVGRALALDPENRVAMTTLVRLITRPPRRLPPEVKLAQRVEVERYLRLGGVASALVYAFISASLVFTIALGVKDWTVVWVAHAFWAAALLGSIVTILRPSYLALAFAGTMGITASICASGAYGPLLIVPGLLSLHATGFALVREPRYRYFILGFAVVGWTLIVAKESLGIFPPVLHFVDGNLIMKSPALHFPESFTLSYVYMTALAMIIVPALLVAAVRESYRRNEERLHVQKWQLEQLVSDTPDSRRS